MKILLPLLLMAVLLVLMAFSQTTASPNELASKADNQDKLVGKWALVKSTNRFNGVPPGCTVEFTRDGVTYAVVATGYQTHRGTYKVEGNRILHILKNPADGTEDEDTVTIITLTDKKLVTKGKSGVMDTYKKK